MGSKVHHKTCATAGCDVSINPRARTNVCASHKHNGICNCLMCVGERRRAAEAAARTALKKQAEELSDLIMIHCPDNHVRQLAMDNLRVATMLAVQSFFETGGANVTS